jgi:trimeric autotransporter adhesin
MRPKMIIELTVSQQEMQKNMTTPSLAISINRSPLRSVFVLIPVVLICFGLSPAGTAVSPPPDGGYPGANTAEGDDALFSLTTGVQNTAIGFQALYANTTGPNNTAIGFDALASNTTGDHNTATGVVALWQNTIGFGNTALGAVALASNTAGNNNTATGLSALSNNTTGSDNTANGVQALAINRTGNNNTANGTNALFRNAAGSNNTATGAAALYNNNANNNTANGYQALLNNTMGGANTANGVNALFSNRTGIQNTANGAGALLLNTTGNGNVAEGAGTLGRNRGSFNTAIGFNAGGNLTTGSDNIDIGALGVAGESNTMRIGGVRQTATFIAGIRGVTTGMANAIPVLIDSAGQLGTTSSSRRFKKEIKPMDQTSEAVLALKPVTFHYKSDKTGTPQFGLIAEEVAQVNPDLVVRDENGEIYTVRYEAVNAMLLNEFLKEHGKVEKLETTVARLQKQIEALTAGLQKVSAQLELSKPAPQVAKSP